MRRVWQDKTQAEAAESLRIHPQCSPERGSSGSSSHLKQVSARSDRPAPGGANMRINNQ